MHSENNRLPCICTINYYLGKRFSFFLVLMFLNISSDQIVCLTTWERHLLPYHDIERSFGPWLLDLIQKHTPSSLYVLNGPGSFTTLRVCCLAINLITKQTPLPLFTCSKPDLFSSLSTTSDFPKIIAITIWQKKNCRLYDCSSKKEEKISFTERQEKDNLLIDPIGDSELIWWQQYADRQIQFQRDSEQQIVLASSEKNRPIDLTAPCRQAGELITPNYLIDPTMG